MIAHVVNARPHRKKAKPAPAAKRRRVNPWEAVVLGANPSRQGSKHMAKSKKRGKKKKKNAGLFGGHHPHKSNPGTFLMRRRNPLPISGGDVIPVIGGAIGGGIISSWAPNKILGATDKGFIGYAANIAVAVVGALLLNRVHPRLALGWLVGGLTMSAGRIFDDLFGSPIVTFQVPTVGGPQAPMGQFYAPSYWSLPDRMDPRLITVLPGGAGRAQLTAGPVAVPVKRAGVGWNPRFAGRFSSGA